jgi:CRP-like cAMP-binding protein
MHLAHKRDIIYKNINPISDSIDTMNFTTQDLLKLLNRVEHFKCFSEQDRRAIIESGQVEHYAKKKIIFDEEGENSGLFVLLSGQVELCRFSPGGHQATIAILEPVGMFNEVAALDGDPNPVTAIAALDSTVWHLSHHNLRNLLTRYPSLSLALLKVMASRNRHLVAHVQDLASRSVVGRTAKLLLELSQGGESAISRRQNTNNQMAGRVATAPEAFSRALHTLRKTGCITCSSKTIQIDQPDQLAEVAEGVRLL